MKAKKNIGLALLVVAIAALVGLIVVSTNKNSVPSSKLTVATTFYPLYDFATRIGGDKTAVTNITPAGSEPHDFEPSPQTLAAIQKSDVFIYNGGTFEPWVDKFLPDYKNTAVKASDTIQLLNTQEGKDPHFWLDPSLAQQVVTSIRDEFTKADPANKDAYTKNAADYTAKLTQLDADFKNGLQTCATRTVVSSHNAFTYLAKRYNIEVIAIAGLSPEAEPSAAKLAEVSRIVKEKNIQYVFFESLVSPRLADTIAQETGAKTAIFDPIEGLSNDDQKQGKNYISIQRENLSALRTALACQ